MLNIGCLSSLVTKKKSNLIIVKQFIIFYC